VIDYTLAHPDRVAALVPVAATVSGYRESMPPRDELKAGIRAGDAERIAAAALRIWAPLRTDPDVDARIRQLVVDNVAGIAAMGTMWQRVPPAVGRLADIEAPTLVVVGDGDQAEHVRTAKILAREIGRARLQVLPGADHNVPVRAEPLFSELLAGFMDGLDRGNWRRER
jgi:pimeloyl-ACP methyl ester carboxylesterase